MNMRITTAALAALWLFLAAHALIQWDPVPNGGHMALIAVSIVLAARLDDGGRLA